MTFCSKKDGRSGDGGVLYVVATPIGNLEDITARAVSVLKQVDVIAAENSGRTRGLCHHYGIDTPVVGYRRENQRVRGPELARRLEAGESVALVTDAGTPGISDPGVYLIHLAVRAGIRVSPIPGPSAVIAGLSISGFPSEEFVFAGFLPSKPGRRREALRRLALEPRTMVFFEAPHRIAATLADLVDILGDRPMVMLREMTKVFEETLRGTAGDILGRLTPERMRGEFTLVVSGAPKPDAEEISEEVRDRMGRLLRVEGLGVKDAALRLSKETGLSYRRMYRELLGEEREAGETRPMEMVKTFKIRNAMGLHARAAAKIVELANQYQSRLYLKKGEQEVDGSSILSILTLSCPKGTEIRARIQGDDSEAFMAALERLLEERFGERQ